MRLLRNVLTLRLSAAIVHSNAKNIMSKQELSLRRQIAERVAKLHPVRITTKQRCRSGYILRIDGRTGHCSPSKIGCLTALLVWLRCLAVQPITIEPRIKGTNDKAKLQR